MSSRAEPELTLARRFAGGSLWRRAVSGALCGVALGSSSVALAAEPDPAPASAATRRDFTKRLLITVVADERFLSTFQQRVSSWFSDGTEVRVTVTSEVDERGLLDSSPTEVRAWIVPLSAERALVTFSSVDPPAPARHLVREVPLRAGFDEVGLERLASVTHSAFVALSEGVEGVEREQAERELGAAGVAASSVVASSESPPPAQPAQPAQPVPSTSAVPPARPDVPPVRRSTIGAAESPTSLLVSAGYGLRIRGPEGVGHGPSLALGVQLRSPRTAFALQLSGQYLFRSEFEAAPFSASVQTTALRVQVGIEPGRRSTFSGQVWLGLGADLARISSTASTSEANAGIQPREDGTHWRGAGELTLGIIRHGELLDVGVYAQAVFMFTEVRYDATTSVGEVLLLKPWPVQPALSIQGRFRSAL